MTLNEAKAYIADENNWHVIGVTDYFRVRRLQYESLTYIAIQTKRMNMTEWYLNKKVVIEWDNSLYFSYDKEHDCLEYSLRPTQMSQEVWKESKK